jgi:hypothetical protein
MFAYQDAQKNDPPYQQHPVVCIVTDFFGASLSGLIFYFGSGWLARRKERKLNGSGDDKFYDEVARELQDKPMVPGLWTKAFAEMGGDDAKARALYIKLRVGQLHNEAALENERQKSETKRKVKEQRLAAEAAKPPLKWYDKLANFLLGCFCGCATLVMTVFMIMFLSDKDSSGPFDETLMIVIVIGGIAFSSGFITYKCFRAVMR